MHPEKGRQSGYDTLNYSKMCQKSWGCFAQHKRRDDRGFF